MEFWKHPKGIYNLKWYSTLSVNLIFCKKILHLLIELYSLWQKIYRKQAPKTPNLGLKISCKYSKAASKQICFQRTMAENFRLTGAGQWPVTMNHHYCLKKQKGNSTIHQNKRGEGIIGHILCKESDRNNPWHYSKKKKTYLCMCMHIYD